MLIAATYSLSHFVPVIARIIHVVEEHDKTAVYLQFPLPLMVLTLNWGGLDSGDSLPYVRSQLEAGQWRYRIDRQAISNDWQGFAETALEPYRFATKDARHISFIIEAINIHSHETGSFSTLNATLVAFNGENQIKLPEEAEIFDTSVDIKIILQNYSRADGLTIVSSVGKGLPIVDRLFNNVNYHLANGAVETRNSYGLLAADFAKIVSPFTRIVDAGKRGVKHIVIGWDHIVFMLLLVIASPKFIAVFKRATAFTVGHCITLSIGGMGYVPSGAWFIPSIELAIAASIVYGGIMILVGKAEMLTTGKVALIGLIHGFGFSFVMKEAYSTSRSIDALNLVGFNLGIELGQIMIYLLTMPILFLLSQWCWLNPNRQQQLLTALCLLVAAFWVVERTFIVARILLP